ncbi:putative porin [Methylotenera sp.]|uniref:putative porin n=1 Tax=Methylotenera sp. TaxID=2051956 RepID=UPI00271E8903|nr:putative porin [Methylotenera sp.]MDO9204579.1 putative porin [Methylotenera sp.]MDP2071291.1 putative porin [Methylotenera sp.]MDP3005208.1 putative porin [Methylotenera sp.]MDP3818110.1 putative porin [Methylotenera sp.]
MTNFFEYETEINMIQAQQLKGISKKQDRDFTARLHDARTTLKPMVAAIATIYLGTAINTAHAGERESLEQLRSTTVNLVNLLVQEGVLSKGKADDLLKQATQDALKAKEKDAVADAASTQNATVDKAVDEKMVRVQYVPEIVKKEMREEIKKEVMTTLNYKAGTRLGMPEWIDRMVWEGDLRFRYQNDKFPTGNPDPRDFNLANGGADLNNTSDDRSRTRLRARLGVKAQVNDWMSAGLRMTTGSLGDPISPNQTQEAASAKYTLGVDRAYMNAEIKPWLNVVGGRFANPWFSTDLVWDPDLAFDGVAVSFTPKINDNWSGFATIGAFPLDEIEGSNLNKAKSKWMYGSQAGIKWTSANKSSAKVGVALYDFDNVEGISNPNNLNSYDATVPVFRTKGNSYFDINEQFNNVATSKYSLASKFRELNLTGEVDIAAFDPVHVILTGDYVRNIGFDSKEISRRTGLNNSFLPKKQVNAYQLKLTVGMPSTYKAHDWQAFAAYKRLEADSVLDAYTDSDFYLGGTNAKGWVLGGSYGLDKNTWLTARWFSADEIEPRGASLFGASLSPLSIDVLMLDLNAKF